MIKRLFESLSLLMINMPLHPRRPPMIRPGPDCCCRARAVGLRHIRSRQTRHQHSLILSSTARPKAADALRWRDFFTTARRQTQAASHELLAAAPSSSSSTEQAEEPAQVHRLGARTALKSARTDGPGSNPVASTSNLTLDQLGITPTGLNTTALVKQEGWRPISFAHPLKQRLKIYMELSKFRLSALVTLTAMAGYAICPVHVDPAATQAATQAFLASMSGGAGQTPEALAHLATVTPPSLSLPVFVWTSLGTALCSASANSFNQISEVPLDAQMNRTRNRVLVRRAITPLHAAGFGFTAGTLGVGLLYHFVNPLTASLGLANILLYAGMYTPLKRISIVNTWLGSLVGAIPPLMGWTACTNSLDFTMSSAGAWGLVALMFAWQFPHFNSLAHSLRHDYAKAGYHMMAVTNPALNARVALRYSFLLFPICAVFSWAGLTSWAFFGLSCVPNAVMAWASVKFWRDTRTALQSVGTLHSESSKKSQAKSARTLFFMSLIHLPVLLVLMMACKTGIWSSAAERVRMLWPSAAEEEAETRQPA